MSRASVLEVGGIALGAMARAAGRRVTRGPLRPTWTWRTEFAAAVMRAVLMESKQRGVPWLRSALLAANVPSPVAKRVRTEVVDAGGVPARWFVPLGAEPRRTIVYFHGGGFVIGGSETHADVLSRFAVHANARVLGVDYRLAPEHRFPAAHDDALAATRWVLAQGTNPACLALGGDSAGGNLAIATLVSMRDAGDPLPAAAALLCPWTDPLAEGGSMATNADADFGDRALLVGWYEDYCGRDAPRDPRVFAVDAKLADLPPLLVQIGGAEILLDQVVAFAERAQAAGVSVQLDVARDLFHDWQLQAALLPEGARSLEEAARFLAERTGA